MNFRFMNLDLRIFASTAVVLTSGIAPGLAESKPDSAAELAAFKLPEGFEISLWADESNGVVKPIQMRWDTRGRLWVIGSVTYPQIKPGEEPNDKVIILEDTDNDGKADKTTVFADGLMIPTGLELGNGGVYVGESEKMWFMKDTDGDDKADVKEVLFRGFGTGDNHQNLNSFRWTPGGELLFCQGLHAYSHVETAYGVVSLEGAGLWRLRPHQMRLDAWYGGPAEPQNPWGFAFTDAGLPLMTAGNNGGVYFPFPEMIRDGKSDAHINVWHNPGTRKSSNPEIVRSAHFPDDWQGVFLSGGYINNSVWALKIEDDGAGYKLTDIPPLVQSTNSAFRPVDVKFGPDGALYLCDWFNPIIGHYQASFRHPDRDKKHGRIWRITAKGRPLNQPPKIAGATIKELLDNLKSKDEWTLYATRIELSSRKKEEVLKAARNYWRKIAADITPKDAEILRLIFQTLHIFEWLDAPEPELLELVLNQGESAMSVYAAGVIVRWTEIGDRNAAAWHVAGNKIEPENKFTATQAHQILTELATDPSPRTRMTAVVALGNIPSPDSVLLALTALDKPTDRFIEKALQQMIIALKPHWKKALEDDAWLAKVKPAHFAYLVKTDGTPESLSAVRRYLEKSTATAEVRSSLLLTLAEIGSASDITFLLTPKATAGLDSNAELQGKLLDAILSSATARNVKPEGDVAALLTPYLGGADGLRFRALVLAGQWKVEAVKPELVKDASQTQSVELQKAAIRGLGLMGGDDAVKELVKLATAGSSPTRSRAIAALVSNDPTIAASKAVEHFSGEFDLADSDRIFKAFTSRKGATAELSKAIAAKPPKAATAKALLEKTITLGVQDQELTKALKDAEGATHAGYVFSPELAAELSKEALANGNAEKGKEIYKRPELTCTACHKIGNEGGVIGPALDSIGSGQPLDFIIGAVLAPQKEIKESFETIEVNTKDGQVYTGYRSGGSDSEVVIRDVATGTQTRITKDKIASQKMTGSLMPAGLLDKLTREELRDLFKYLSGLGKAK